MDINYLSDDEVQNDKNSVKYDSNNYNDYLPYSEDDEEEMDEEEIEYFRQQNIIIMNALNKKSFDGDIDFVKENKIEKSKEPKKNKNMNVGEFNNYINEIIKEKQPKKFVSNRFLEKKKFIDTNSTNNKLIEISKRKFNPRLPPYFEVYPKYNKY
jgi:hypothetical protein